MDETRVGRILFFRIVPVYHQSHIETNMPSFCVIAIDVDHQELFLDVVLADNADGAAQIVDHLRPNATSVVSLDPTRMWKLAKATEQLTEEAFVTWLESFNAPTGGQTEPLTIRRWIAGSASYPDVEAGASADDLLQAVAGDLNNSSIVDTISRIVFEASDGCYYTVTAEAVLERSDNRFVEKHLLRGQ
jgi:hypothetical protein